MIGYLRTVRDERRARRIYELARLRTLMEQNQRRLDEMARREAEGCVLCKATR